MTTRAPVRVRSARPGLLLALGLLLVGGCGEDAARPGVRVRLHTSATDGPVQGTVRFQLLEGFGGEVFDAEPLGGDAPDVWVSAAAPEGRYRVLTSEGWGMLWPGGPASPGPLLRGADHPPPSVRMGRPRTIYLAPGDPTFGLLTTDWGAQVRAPDAPPGAPFERVPVEVDEHGESVVSLRFAPEPWQPGATIRMLGRLAAGPLTELLEVPVRTDVFPVLPRLVLVRPATHALLDVLLVPPPGLDAVPDGTRVEVRPQGLPLDVVYEGVTQAGRKRFDGVALLGGGLQVALADGGPGVVFDLAEEDWRLHGSITVVAVDPAHAAPVELAQDGDEVLEVRALFPGAARFARLPLAREAGTTRLLAPPGPQDWCVRLGGDRWVVQPLTVPAPGTAPAVTRLREPAAKGCTVRGAVNGGGTVHRVEFVLELPATDGGEGQVARPLRRAGGEGFVVAVSPQGQYEASLPPGAYAIRVLAPSGTGGAPRRMELRPGMQMRMDLDLR